MLCGTDSTPLRPTLSIAIPFAVSYKIRFAYMKRAAKGGFTGLAPGWDRRQKLDVRHTMKSGHGESSEHLVR